MKSTYVGFLAFLAAAVQAQGTCNADNCARAATGSAGGAAAQSSRLAACSSYQQCTVIPATSTVVATATVTLAIVSTTSTTTTIYTATATVTTTVPGPNKRSVRVEKRYNPKRLPEMDRRIERRTAPAGATTICPTAIPSDPAKYCTPITRYASACSCAGITKDYITAAAPSTTVTTSITLTAVTSTVVVTTSTTTTQTSTATATFPTFVLRISAAFYDGENVGTTASTSSTNLELSPTTGDPTEFYLDANSYLRSATDNLYTYEPDSEQPGGPIGFTLDPATANIQCQNRDGILYCSATRKSRPEFRVCVPAAGGYSPDAPYLGLFTGDSPDGCHPATIYAMNV